MKARIILGITEQVGEYEYERHYDWVDVEVLPPYNRYPSYRRCDIIGGKWLEDEPETQKGK